MKFLPKETEILSLKDKHFVLTNYRVELTEKDLGESDFISIFLEDVSSIEIKYRSNIIFIFLAIISFVTGAFLKLMITDSPTGDNRLLICAIAGTILLTIWRLTRKHIFIITSNGGSSLKFPLQGTKKDQIENISYEIFLAKQSRTDQISKQTELQ